MTDFTPLQSLAGGGLIGLASVLLMLAAGRIMGATGIVAGLMQPQGPKDFSWRAALVAGMMSAPMLIWMLSGTMPTVAVPVSPTAIVVGGFIVGLGATLGSGCTSGHGVCGIARLSPRSIIATGCFMVTCALTVYIIRHVIGG